MDLQKELNELKNTEEQLKEIQRRNDLLATFVDYSGEDRIITSLELIEEIKNAPIVKGYLSLIPKLDEMTGGFREGNLITLSGVTASGKTTFAQTLLRGFAEQTINCLFLTYEVSNEEFIRKFGEVIPVFSIPRRYKKSKMMWLEHRIIEAIAKYDTKIIFIDHLHYLVDMEKLGTGGNVSLLIGSVMRELKRMAIEYKIIIFLMAHFKQVKLQENEMPDIGNLRDSSFIGQESDCVMIINRKKTEDRRDWLDEASLFVAKNRWNGKTGYINLVFQDNQFKEICLNYESEPIN
jgi:replicative DNA helicase